MQRISFKTIGTGLAILVSLLVLIIVGNGLVHLDIQSREAGRTVALEAIERSVMQCYALEGAYPPDLEYLEQYYGLILDEQRYVYQYEIVASNIHPIIGVQFPGENE
jgi:hypothetical protein